MTEIVRAGQLTVSLIQAAGDGEPGTAAAVEIPTSHTVLLVELPVPDSLQGIKLPEGRPGDRVDIHVISRPSTSSLNATKLRIFDADDNSLVGTDASGAITMGGTISATKILPAPYSESGFVSGLVGTWLGYPIAITQNIPST